MSHTILRGREYIEHSDGSQWTRKVDAETGEPSSEWTAVEPAPVSPGPNEPSTTHLSVVARHQAEGEPKHWALFSHRPDPASTGPGLVWQVTGDAEHMHHEHLPDTDILSSDDFAWHQVVNADISSSQFARVDGIARAEPAPRAANRAAVFENCQGWVIRVLRRLIEEENVEESAVAMLQGYMDPV